ncbi:aldehyde dehydrogenase [Paraliomyxa miuraensis]|uniref:aldehyde dehydrogenase n=1 Tax=Paraliomyxa miuraensis TaxID=376150 RepID=UPI0022590BB0|nr:aldehyde dehydrogenase [Paraliomyxa miuraensis]MCX4242716.1 aldehyde dehydrogenase [Paraliomyxa miuraensis]
MDGSGSPGSAPLEVAATPELHGQALHDRIDELYEAQRQFFGAGRTLPQAAREDALRALLHAFETKEKLIIDALHADLHKSTTEAYFTEVGYTTAEIKHTLRHLGRWMKPDVSLAPLAIAPSRSYIHYQPLGLNLIVAPWNYPVQLAFAPVTGALAAGNVAILKPSELAPASSAACAEIAREAFDPAHVAVLEGGVETSQALLARRWDHIFFTGGTGIGRVVAKAGAEHLSRVTLELGGKSPCIVTASADLDVAARRIVWGKLVNAGQTCVAPDYLLVEASVHDGLVSRMKAAIRDFYGEDPSKSADYGRIINDRHFLRLVGLIDPDKVAHGGQHDREQRYIAPTLMTDVSMDDRVMADEIFGPLLPIMRIDSLDEAIATVAARPNPLALYLFTQSGEDERKVIERVSFGGGCINNTLAHLADPDLPFGGVGESGMGAYHGRNSFEAFSHRKSVLKTANFLDPSIKYPPYEGKLKYMRKLVG